MTAAPLAGTVSLVMGPSVGPCAAVAQTLLAQGVSIGPPEPPARELYAVAAPRCTAVPP